MPIRATHLPTLAGVVMTIALMGWFSTWTGEDAPGGGPALLLAVFVEGVWPAALWLLAAAGFGLGACRVIGVEMELPIASRVGVGIAILLWSDHTLGALGLLTLWGSWIIAACGLALLLITIARSRQAAAQSLSDEDRTHWWVAAPAIAVLLVAACSAPGWLWGTEFGGFDALSYHLQLPKEWLAFGRITPLDHNVYGYLPSYVESAFLHVMALRGDAVAAGVSCQLLHAIITILLGAVMAELIGHITCRALRPLGWALTLGTTWAVVVGSLAYNEMFAALMLAVGLRIVFTKDLSATRTGMLLGLLAATACGAKLTAIGFVALPLGVIALMSRPSKQWLSLTGVGITVGLIALLPWLVRNAIACGNPFFPFLTDLFGHGHWTAEQSARWSEGHLTQSTGVLDRVIALWQQLFIFGFGGNPSPGEPWAPQWSILFWLALFGVVLGAIRNGTQRRLALCTASGLGCAIIFWLAFTHLQSRFMTPAIPLLVIAATIGLVPAICSKDDTTTRLRMRWVIVALAILYSCQPALQFARERAITGGIGQPAAAIGTEDIYTGDEYSQQIQQQLAASGLASVAVNHLLPRESHVLLIGEARPFYYDLDRITYQTVWDESPLAAVLRGHPDSNERWISALREQEFTHVLLNMGMLRRWRLTEQLDPAIDPDSVQQALTTNARLLATFGPDLYLFELPAAP